MSSIDELLKADASASCSALSTCAPLLSSFSIVTFFTPASSSSSASRLPKPVDVRFCRECAPVFMTACSRPSLVLAVASMCISYVPLVHSLYTCTALVWPMRWQRAIACMSFCGFQSGSKMITVSAETRLMPCPPARVDSMKMKVSLALSEKRSMAFCRSEPAMLPSSRSKSHARASKNSSIRSSTLVNCEKTSTRWPSTLSFGSSLSSSTNLPDDWISRSV